MGQVDGGRVARVERMAELVDYQEGSVVSRQLVKAGGGNVTLFAFDEGEGLTEHTSPFDALVYVLDGDAEVAISDKLSQLRAGDMILMPGQRAPRLESAVSLQDAAHHDQALKLSERGSSSACPTDRGIFGFQERVCGPACRQAGGWVGRSA